MKFLRDTCKMFVMVNVDRSGSNVDSSGCDGGDGVVVVASNTSSRNICIFTLCRTAANASVLPGDRNCTTSSGCCNQLQ